MKHTPIRERIAVALSECANAWPETSRDAPFVRSHRLALADAAIASMRAFLEEPTEEMIKAGRKVWGDWSVDAKKEAVVFRAMLKEAFKPDGGKE